MTSRRSLSNVDTVACSSDMSEQDVFLRCCGSEAALQPKGFTASLVLFAVLSFDQTTSFP